MKFTDGQWLLRAGVTAHYASEAHALAVERDRLVVHAPVRPIKQRGDTLQGPSLTITVSSPLPNIARIRIQHFTGRRSVGPEIPLVPTTNAPVQIHDGAEAATANSP